jgi:hypothetical protein
LGIPRRPAGRDPTAFPARIHTGLGRAYGRAIHRAGRHRTDDLGDRRAQRGGVELIRQHHDRIARIVEQLLQLDLGQRGVAARLEQRRFEVGAIDPCLEQVIPRSASGLLQLLHLGKARIGQLGVLLLDHHELTGEDDAEVRGVRVHRQAGARLEQVVA